MTNADVNKLFKYSLNNYSFCQNFKGIYLYTNMILWLFTPTHVQKPSPPCIKRSAHIWIYKRNTFLWVHHHQGHIYSLNPRNRNVRTFLQGKKVFHCLK